MFENCRRKNLV